MTSPSLHPAHPTRCAVFVPRARICAGVSQSATTVRAGRRQGFPLRVKDCCSHSMYAKRPCRGKSLTYVGFRCRYRPQSDCRLIAVGCGAHRDYARPFVAKSTHSALNGLCRWCDLYYPRRCDRHSVDEVHAETIAHPHSDVPSTCHSAFIYSMVRRSLSAAPITTGFVRPTVQATSYCDRHRGEQ